ncbi:protein transport protein sec31 [Daphnia magna]|uniref:Cuticle protein n=1 Tax=Daphnia magna TaxID=35525 RepID=A0A164WCS8_9CRUS|nr:protein transport protein sec31 [Daphnia magna]KZS13151.1 Uncharacterized protein APZ42_021787 [Daphnia magna]
MNSFKTIVALCVVMAATCSGAYRTPSWATQPAAVPAPAPHAGYGNKVWGNSNVVATPVAIPQTYSAPTPVQEAPVAPAPTQHSFPTTTQQICTCVAVPAGSTGASVATTAPLDRPQQAAQQTYSAPDVAPAPAFAQQTVFHPASQHSGY